MPEMKAETRTARYKRAIDELMRSDSRSKAGEHAGVGPGTFDRWHQEAQIQGAAASRDAAISTALSENVIPIN